MDFIDWLELEMKKRAWRPADLAKAAGLYQSTLGKVLNRERSAGADVCTALSEALKLPPEEVFRRAGLLPPLPGPDNDPSFGELLSYMKRLSVSDRRDVLAYALFRYRQALERPSALANDESPAASQGGPTTATA